MLADKDVSINWSTILQSPQGEETLKSLLDSVGVSGLSSAEEEKLLSDYVLCMQKISGNDVSQPLQLTQVLSILKDWAPNQDMICLFVRWAKKNPQHFNTSSIATLRCLAKQTRVKTPLLFLKKARTYLVCHRNKNTHRGGFGVRFRFKPRDSKEKMILFLLIPLGYIL